MWLFVVCRMALNIVMSLTLVQRFLNHEQLFGLKMRILMKLKEENTYCVNCTGMCALVFSAHMAYIGAKYVSMHEPLKDINDNI